MRWLWEYHGAPKLDDCVRRYSGIRPRNVTITQEEHRALIDAAPKHVKLWLHLCSDLAMRSGTAAKIAPHNYDPATGLLKFTTKYNERLTLPVTQEIADLFAQCDQKNSASFARQLWQRKSGQQAPRPGELTLHRTSLSAAFRKACKAARIHRNIRPARPTPHDSGRHARSTHTMCATCKPSLDTATSNRQSGISTTTCVR